MQKSNHHFCLAASAPCCCSAKQTHPSTTTSMHHAVPATLPALEAFGFMARDHKSALGLTDGGKLVGNLSVSDIR